MILKPSRLLKWVRRHDFQLALGIALQSWVLMVCVIYASGTGAVMPAWVVGAAFISTMAGLWTQLGLCLELLRRDKRIRVAYLMRTGEHLEQDDASMDMPQVKFLVPPSAAGQPPTTFTIAPPAGAHVVFSPKPPRR